jgi:hypothetical protein
MQLDYRMHKGICMSIRPTVNNKRTMARPEKCQVLASPWLASQGTEVVNAQDADAMMHELFAFLYSHSP